MTLPQPLSWGEAQALLDPLGCYSHLALAVSGGPDSVALLHLIARWRGVRGAGPRVSVLTVDHGIRPEAPGEAMEVARMAESLGLPHAILAWTGRERRSGGLQQSARIARYDLMAGYCHRNNIAAIVTAHHLDDQAETLLMRLARGSGLDGLAAIPERGSWAGIAVLRPLLDVSKARLVATLNAGGIAFAEDASNQDPRFERARLRGCGDALAKLGLSAAALARSARRLRRARAALDQAAEAHLSTHGRISEAGYGMLDARALAAAPEEIALRVLAKAVAAVDGRDMPPRLAKLEALLAALKQAPAKAHTIGGCRLQPAGHELGVFRETRRRGLPVLTLSPGERALWDSRFRVELGDQEREPVTVRALGEVGWRDASGASGWLAALPRFARATLPACWRGDGLIFVPELDRKCAFGRGRATHGFLASFVNAPGRDEAIRA
jgi:tRNA(Ile)-lysidine synthase